MTAEIDGVQRSMRRYLGASSFSLMQFSESRPAVRSTTRSAATPRVAAAGTTPPATESAHVPQSRGEQILQVLKDQDGIGIKDFHAVIYDCSEKTIQRELMSLIDNGLVRREGERRWSKYFLV